MNIECEFKDANWYGGVTLYSCFVSSASFTESLATINSFRGVHAEGKSDKDVQGIQFSKAVVQYFPRGLDNFFPSLIGLSIHDCGLKKMHSYDFKELPKLEMLTIVYNNQLTSLPDELFVNMNNLKFIDLSQNKLKIMSSKLLKPVMNNALIFINFRNNENIDACYNSSKAQPTLLHRLRYRPKSDETLEAATVADLMKIIDKKCTPPSKIEEPSREEFVDEFNHRIERMWLTGQLPDFTITVGTKNFRVHKNILAVNSSVFARMFTEDTRPSMNVEDLSERTVEDVLRYFYTGCISSDIRAVEVFKLSSKLKVPVLKEFSGNLILDEIEESNAYEIFCLGHAYESMKLKSIAFEEIRKIFPEKNLSDDLMQNPDGIKELIEMKRKLESLTKKFEK